ncbi:MAG TPA: CmcI family methyltransferase [Chthoniobacterales bacterium]|nr:CmcI family methyltransferase [Chthoniobacterales bacterium]
MSETAAAGEVEHLPGQRFLEDHLDLTVREMLPMMQARIVDRTSYFGIQTLKNPLDFWIYQELIHAVQPDVILEIGNFRGGSLLALAHLCDLRQKGRLIGVDLEQKEISEIVRAHPRVTLLEGDAVAQSAAIRAKISPSERVLIIEDSSHTCENTLAVLREYWDLVCPGSYFIVEDGNCHHGLDLGPFPGPYEAITEFIQENKNFVIDRACESFFVTWNPRGYLRRIAS